MKIERFFMKATKLIKIRLEKHELKVVRFGFRKSFFCEKCQKEMPHLTIAEVANALGITEKNVFHLVESEQFHSVETAEGKVLICKKSLEV